MKDFIHSVVDGLVKPSLLSLLVAAATVLATTSTYLYFANPGFVIKNANLLATYDGDDDIYLTATILKQKQQPIKPVSVYLVGDSTLREAVFENDLKNTLLIAGKDYQIVDLRSGYQSLLESLAIVDNINRDAQGVVVLGISANSLTIPDNGYESGASSNRRGFTSAALAKLLSTSNRKSYDITNIYGLDNINFLLPRYIRYLLSRNKTEIKRVTHQLLHQAPISCEEMEFRAQRYLLNLIPDLEKYSTAAEFGISILESIATNIESKPNLTLALLEKPLNPYFTQKYLSQEFREAYRNRIFKFASMKGIDYQDPADHIIYNIEDFADLVHVNGGRTAKQYTQFLASYIIENY